MTNLHNIRLGSEFSGSIRSPGRRLGGTVRTNLWLLAILVSSMSPTGFQVRHQPGRLRGIVTDQVGEVIPLAAVLVHPDPQMTKLREALDFGEDIRLQANQKGEFTATLAAGVYDVV